MNTNTLDQICKRRTGFTSFDELVNRTAPSYRPSIEVATPEMIELADAYDEVMEARGDWRRAYRYGTPPPIVEKPGTTFIGGFHVTLRFHDDVGTGEHISECWVGRGRESSSLALVMEMGGIDGDTKFIEVPDRVVRRIERWATSRGY